VQSEDKIPHIIRRIVEENGNVYNVTARRLSLEEIYFALFEKRREKGASK
jgi:ABC-2 type transport system ATP-binding protein